MDLLVGKKAALASPSSNPLWSIWISLVNLSFGNYYNLFEAAGRSPGHPPGGVCCEPDWSCTEDRGLPTQQPVGAILKFTSTENFENINITSSTLPKHKKNKFSLENRNKEKSKIIGLVSWKGSIDYFKLGHEEFSLRLPRTTTRRPDMVPCQKSQKEIMNNNTTKISKLVIIENRNIFWNFVENNFGPRIIIDFN